jgi:5-methylcytosine-specific restriction protein B
MVKEVEAMFNHEIFKEAVSLYKEDFLDFQWKNEKFKWEAVKCFRDNWDINADNFAQMLSKAFAKSNNLLASVNYFPAKMITAFAKLAPEEVRSMFIELFDESKDLCERISNFKSKSQELLGKYGNGAAQHYQKENSIMTYLWLRFPDKYYIYKLSEIKSVSEKLESSYEFKKGFYNENITNFIAFYDEICAELLKDNELRELLNSQITADCYSDPMLHTLTIDVAFYISRYLEVSGEVPDDVPEDGWWPTDYSPNLSVEDWVKLINNSKIFTPLSLQILQQIRECGGQASCKQLSVKYGRAIAAYVGGVTGLARRIMKETGCEPCKEGHGANWWTILFVGKFSEEEKNIYIWKLRDELAEALEQVYPSEPTVTTDSIEKYSKNDFLNDVYMTEAKYDRLVSVLQRKKNIILQGAPGVGKTFAARRLAWSIMGEKDNSRIEFVQFHQNYSYEDFVMGYKPVKDTFEIKNGVFYRFCVEAAKQPDKDFFFIIDEINRGNMSKIFGELLMLIESDYRGEEITLAYDDEKRFSVPKNLYIIGMMNTADRSLAMIDYALRRRFSFFDIEPGFDSDGFIKYQKKFSNDTFDTLIDCIKELNQTIARDNSLGKGFCIGHSYFCNASECTTEWMKDVVDFDILPMLSEYWFDNDSELQRWESNLHGVFK